MVSNVRLKKSSTPYVFKMSAKFRRPLAYSVLTNSRRSFPTSILLPMVARGSIKCPTDELRLSEIVQTLLQTISLNCTPNVPLMTNKNF